MEYPILFLIGGGLYVLCELFWRGRSHISMAVAGGVSLILLYGVFTRFAASPILEKCLMGGLIITAVEFITGYFVNLRMRLAVWDYSTLPLNLYGQVCLRYTLIWCALAAPASAIVDIVYTISHS